VFNNPVIWIVAVANFFVYTVRYAVLDWGPTLLHEAKGFELHQTGWIVASFELSGLAGMVLSGWITDRFFGGRGARTCLVYMLLCTAAVYAFWKLPVNSMLASIVVLSAAGFLIYGPQCLVGIIAANLATKRAAATAVGLTGIFGYLSTIVSGWGLGLLVDRHGWGAGLAGIVGFSAVGTLLFALAWPARPHGYSQAQE
jgi:sugar phosphate permease